jgi:hypothetical protein
LNVYQPDAHLVDGQKVSSTLIRNYWNKWQVEQREHVSWVRHIRLQAKLPEEVVLDVNHRIPDSHIEPEDPLKLVPRVAYLPFQCLADGNVGNRVC